MSESPVLYEPTTQSLPPSPELKSRRHHHQQQHVVDSEFSLDDPPPPPADRPKDDFLRLRTVARYQAFHPQALACSDILTSSLDSNPLYEDPLAENPSSGEYLSQRNKGSSSQTSSPNATTSLGAIAGSQGVALFRLSRPHVPLLILSHATSFRSKVKTNISGLAFHSHSKKSQIYLAAARGSATLVWDASGHSQMPLVGRLGSDVLTQDVGDDGQITSLCWKPTSRHASSSAPLLATSTANSVSLWDLRVAPQGSASSSSKPTLRFAVSKRSASLTSTAASVSPKVLQVACASGTDELGCIDSSGVVRIYDIRKNDRNRTPSGASGSAVSIFQAHDTVGVGLCAFQTTMEDSFLSTSSWLTWGLDSASSSAVVKCWSYQNNDDTPLLASGEAADPDDYWYMAPYYNNQSNYSLRAQLASPNLAAARICPSPFENSFLAVGHLDSKSSDDKTNKVHHGWWAEMCQLTPLEDRMQGSPMSTASAGSFGLETTIRFEGGASASPNRDQEVLVSALGGHADLGRLQAAELAFGSIPRQGYSSTQAEDSKEEDRNSNQHRVELVLCCLSDTSVITTHSVADIKTKGGQRVPSPLRPRLVKTSFPSSHQPKVYQEDRTEGTSLVDAAGFWNSTAAGAVDAQKTLTEELGRLSMHARAPSYNEVALMQPSDLATDEPEESDNNIEDMEVPVAYGSVSANQEMAITDIASGTVVTTGGLSVVDEEENANVDVREATPILENIESGRVPCPPLCGASFGFGHGGLVMFHNGEINKMWNWYQRTDTTRLQSMPRGKDDTAPSGNELLSPRVGVDSDDKRTAVYGPRTLKELVKMTEAAKEAQWGVRDGSDGSESDNDDLTTDENFFEEESSDSDSTDSDENVTVPSSNHMYNRYFGARAWKGTVKGEEKVNSHRRTHSDASASTPTKNTPEIIGPSYEMLAPTVRVTRDFDKAIICNQSIELAQRWDLGRWEDLSLSEALMSESKMAEYYELGGYDGGIPLQILGQGLPGYKYLEPAWGTESNLQRTKSESNFDFGMLSLASDDDSTRFPRNMPMYPAMFSTPEQYPTRGSDFEGGLFSGNLARTSRREDEFPWKGQRDDKRKRFLEIGVYKLRDLPTPEVAEAIEVLERIKTSCQKNADACKELKETEKEGVWRLLAETVDGRIKSLSKCMEGGSDRAIGGELVSNLFSYYESIGDVQMLATMFCVLSGGVRSTIQPSSTRLLPPDNDAKYDAYIKKYAELLYAWDLLSVRAEVRKHLRHFPRQPKTELTGESPSHAMRHFGNNEMSAEETANANGGDDEESPGVSIVIQCPGCDVEMDLNKQGNYCQTCQDFPFRCSLCDNAVRGQFTYCSYCKHGGHLDHMTDWFVSYSKCPTGCGCKCKLANVTTTILE